MKMFTRILTIAMLSLAPLLASADDFLKDIKDFELVDHLGVTHKLSEYESKQYIVLYTHGVGCPIARLSVPSYLAVRDDYASKNIEFLMINASIQDDIPRIQTEATEFNINFPILKDEDQSVARSLGVERTAEVFIIDPRTHAVLFRGPIDDSLGYEAQRATTDHHYLRDALDTVLKGEQVNMDDIPDSKGCLIGFFLS
ncbi:MAG: redoxin domain-containing protein [Pseudomonadota bacterium]